MKVSVKFWRWVDKKLSPTSRYRRHLSGVLRRDGIIRNWKFMRLSKKYTKPYQESKQGNRLSVSS